MSGAAAAGCQPWLGLLPYGEADQELFFGREDDTRELLRLVRREVVTVLFGRSGTGKSSLLRAGLFPKLRQEQYLPVWIRLDHSGRTTYGRQVRGEIAAAVAASAIEVETLGEALADESDDIWEYLHRVIFWDAKNQPVTPVLVFDQFEELFTLGRGRPEIAAFFEELAAVAENLIPRRLKDKVIADGVKLPAVYNERHYKLMVSLREDYVSRLDSLSKDMPSVMHNRHALTHMTGGQALDVVLKPGGDLVDETVARKIVRFVAAANDVEAVAESPVEPDLENLRIEPALLSLVCSELNLQRDKEGRPSITLEQVQRSSDQILEDFYERSLEGLDASDRGFIEDRLVTASGFRTMVPAEEAISAGLSGEEIEKLVARRLLRQEDRLGTPHIELTHDVLTRVVTRSRGMRQRREEEEQLRREAELELAERRKAKELGDIEKTRTRRMRNTRRAVWGVLGLATLLAAVAVILLISRREVEQARRLASARALALKGVDVLRQDPELALLLSIESAMATFPESKEAGDAPPEIEAALRTATRESLIRRRYEGHTSKVFSVDFDPEGRRLVTGAWHPDATARVWDVDSGKEIARLDHGALPGGKTTVSCARFSPDGKKIVTATYRDDGAVYVWDASSPAKPLLTFTGHRAWVTTAAFSPDGKTIASGGYDNLVRVWDATTGRETGPALGSGRIHHTERIRSVVFNASGTRLLSTSDDGNAILWDVTPGGMDAIQVFAGDGKETLHDGDFSPSGKLVATVGNDRHLRVWDAATGLQIAAQGHPDGVMGVAFIGEDRIVTVCNDSAIRFWILGNAAEDAIGSFHPEAESVRVLRLLATQKGHAGWIRDVAVSPDKRFIATCGDDTSVRLWKIPPGGETAVIGAPDFVSWTADIHLAGEKLFAYAGTGTGSIRGFDAFTERELDDWGPLAADEIHGNEVRSLEVSPDGATLVTSSSDQTAIVWDTATGRPKFSLAGHRGPGGGTVYRARYSADGKRIVTASDEGCARIWNAADGSPQALLVPDRREFGPGAFRKFPALLDKLRAATDGPAGLLLAGATPEERAILLDPAADPKPALAAATGLLGRLVRGPALDAEPALAAIVRRPVTLAWAGRHPAGDDLQILNRLLLEDAFPGEIARAGIYDARFNRDGTRVVTADFESRAATIWDAATGRPVRVLGAPDGSGGGHRDNVMSAAFRPDGKAVVTACMDGICRVWNTATGAMERAIPHNVAVRAAEYSPDGKLLLTAAADGVARLWTTSDFLLRTELKGHTETLAEARFSSDGAYIVTASRDGTARVYLTDPWWIYGLANGRVTRKLTEAERDLYGVTRNLTTRERAYYRKKAAAATVAGGGR